jgi:hypothetical protein
VIGDPSILRSTLKDVVLVYCRLCLLAAYCPIELSCLHQSSFLRFDSFLNPSVSLVDVRRDKHFRNIGNHLKANLQQLDRL